MWHLPGFLESRGCAEKVVHRDHFIHVVRHGDDMHGHFSHCFLDRIFYLVVSHIFIFTLFGEDFSNLTNIFQMG